MWVTYVPAESGVYWAKLPTHHDPEVVSVVVRGYDGKRLVWFLEMKDSRYIPADKLPPGTRFWSVRVSPPDVHSGTPSPQEPTEGPS